MDLKNVCFANTLQLLTTLSQKHSNPERGREGWSVVRESHDQVFNPHDGLGYVIALSL